MEPIKVTKDFSPPSAAKTIIHKIPHQIRTEADNLSCHKFSSVSSKATSSGEVNTSIIKKKYQPLPEFCSEEIEETIRAEKEKKKNLKRIAANNKQISKDYDGKNWFKIIISVVIIAFAIIGFAFLIMLGNGVLSPQFNNTFDFDASVELNAPITNDFQPIINNEYRNKYTIINNVTCPEQICVCENIS